jgi:hypothetical protein
MKCLKGIYLQNGAILMFFLCFSKHDKLNAVFAEAVQDFPIVHILASNFNNFKPHMLKPLEITKP